MRRWSNLSQMKEQDKIRARDLSKMEISNMPSRKFKVLIIKILTGFEKKVENISETLNKEIKKEAEMKKTINEINIHYIE